MAELEVLEPNEDIRQCTPCKKDNLTVDCSIYCMDCEAYFCDDCFKFHRKIPNLANHVILRNEEIGLWGKLQYKCKAHGRSFEYFCDDHSDLCCQVCVSLEHRSCENMKFIEVTSNYKDLTNRRDKVAKKAKQQTKKIDSATKRLEKNIEQNEASKAEADKRVTDFRAEIDSKLDSWEENARRTIDDMFTKNAEKMREIETGLKVNRLLLCGLMDRLRSQSQVKVMLSFINLEHGQRLIECVEREVTHVTTTLPKTKYAMHIDTNLESLVLTDSLRHLDTDGKTDVAISSEEWEDDTSTNINVYDDSSNASKNASKSRGMVSRHRCRTSNRFLPLLYENENECDESDDNESDGEDSDELEELCLPPSCEDESKGEECDDYESDGKDKNWKSLVDQEFPSWRPKHKKKKKNGRKFRQF